jgi:hypothetical protein
MQAVEVGNTLAGKQIQQLTKLRQLMMAQINAQNVYMANPKERDAQRAATQHEGVKNGNREAPVLPTTSSVSVGVEALACDVGRAVPGFSSCSRQRVRAVLRGTPCGRSSSPSGT